MSLVRFMCFSSYSNRMKTFLCWCAANIGLLGIIQALHIIGVTLLFRMEELEYLGKAPLYLGLGLLVFIIPGKSYMNIVARLLVLFGIMGILCFKVTIISHTTKVVLTIILVFMITIGLVIAIITTRYIWNNFSEVTSRRMLYRNSPVEMFNIRLNYCILQFLETFAVMSALVLLIIVCVEIRPAVEAQKAGNDGYWALQVYKLFSD